MRAAVSHFTTADYGAPMLDPSNTESFAGRYRIIEELGRGGMGAVYRAEQLGLGREVALKVMLPQGEADTQARHRARFEREMRLTARLTHPHIVRVFDFGEVDGAPFFTMELVSGEPLSRRLSRESRLDIEVVKTLTRQIASALTEAHAMGLVHRDLKPDNLILSEVQGQVFARVLDFGVAHEENDATPLTRTGTILGTALYMSPEQARGQPVDGRSDLYALGCILYEALTGRPPCVGADFISTLVTHIQEVPVPVRELRPEVPESLARLVEDLLAKDPSGRPATAQLVLARLDQMPEMPEMPEARGGATSAVRDTVTVEHNPTRKASKWPWWALAVVVVGVGVFMAIRGEPTVANPDVPMDKAASAVATAQEPSPKKELTAAERTEEERKLYDDLIRLTASSDWEGARRRLVGVTVPETGEFAVPLHYLVRMVNENLPK
jgi:tRNA A-37 threonylcarbamoyl transferase component Bud32